MLAIVLTDATVEPAVLHGLLRTGRRPDLGPAQRRRRHEHERHGLRPRLGRRRRRAGRGRAAEAAATLGAALEAVARDLARQQAADGEGATTLITCQVTGAVDDADARAVARAVISSSLVKAAAHGRDPNWGRIVGAAGNARLADAAVLEAGGLSPADGRRREPVDRPPSTRRGSGSRSPAISSSTGRPAGRPSFDRAAARERDGCPGDPRRGSISASATASGEAFGCDLTEAYVIENSEYTT